MRRTAVRSLGLTVVAAALAACSSSEPEPGTSRVSVGEAMTVSASAETKSELGVEVWGADAGDAGALHMTGYAADGRVAFVLDQRTVLTDDAHHTFETTVSGRTQATMRLDGTVGAVDDTGHFEIALDMSENGFPDSPLATKVLELAQKDLESVADAPVASSLLAPMALRPMTDAPLVTSGCGSLVKSCAKGLIKATKPLVPCAQALLKTRKIIRCASAGAAAGPLGAFVGGAVCGLKYGPAIVDKGSKCIDNVKSIYETWTDYKESLSTACNGTITSCTSGSPTATSSLATPPDEL